MSTPQPTANKVEEVFPLPKWMVRVYYIFPIVLFVPDMIFNFFVYIKGTGVDMANISVTDIPLMALWAFVAAGLVGMTWLLSVMAPWHWAKGNQFQSVMCWIGVLVATGITTWCSLAYRASEITGSFPTDRWFADAFGLKLGDFSPTTVIVACSPPFWGLFWAIVQPNIQKRSAAEERESHKGKLERIQQEAEIKRAKAEASSQIREAQLKGIASTVRSARAQMGGAPPVEILTSAPIPETVVTEVPPQGMETGEQSAETQMPENVSQLPPAKTQSSKKRVKKPQIEILAPPPPPQTPVHGIPVNDLYRTPDFLTSTGTTGPNPSSQPSSNSMSGAMRVFKPTSTTGGH